MTMLAQIVWKCHCGFENKDQLWIMDDAEKCGEDYVNGMVPDDCDLNWAEPCKRCGKYELSSDYRETSPGFLGWDIVPTDDA